MATLIIGLAVALSAAMALGWLLAERTGRCGWIDVVWSFSVGIAGVAGALVPVADGAELSQRQCLVAALAGLWSLRLGLHVAARTAGGGEDPRYAQLRKEWGSRFGTLLFWFAQLQTAAALLLVVSILVAARNPAPGLRFSDALGVLVLLVAVGGEALADRQLARFRADPSNKGGVCDIGLWGRSRHPNYFFEWLGWIAYTVIAITLDGSYPWGWLALSGPVFMYWLLVHVSGIPPLEAHMLRSRGECFRAYQARVNAFWPGRRQAPHCGETP